MPLPISALIIASLLSPLPAAMANGELFSEIAVESVFQAKENTPTEENTKAADDVQEKKNLNLARIAGAAQLAKLLQEAGNAAEIEDGTTVTTNVQLRGIERTATLKVAVDRDLIEIKMPLRKIPEDEALDMESLMALMRPDSELPNASFGYLADKRTVEIRYSVGNRNLSAGRLISLIKSLLELVERREPVVEINPITTPTVNETASNRARNLAEASNSGSISSEIGSPSMSLPIGTWVAKRGTKEAFALEISPSSQFKLVHVKATRTITSTGTARLEGDQLVLQDSPYTKLQATLLSLTNDQFRIELGGRRIAFNTAK